MDRTGRNGGQDALKRGLISGVDWLEPALPAQPGQLPFGELTGGCHRTPAGFRKAPLPGAMSPQLPVSDRAHGR